LAFGKQGHVLVLPEKKEKYQRITGFTPKKGLILFFPQNYLKRDRMALFGCFAAAFGSPSTSC